MVTTNIENNDTYEEKWTPGPVVVEADLDEGVKAREFARGAWTPDGLPGKNDGSALFVSAPCLPTKTPLIPPLQAGGQKKPALPQKPVTAKRTKPVPAARPVSVPSKNGRAGISGNPLGVVLSDPGIPTVPLPKPRLRSSKDPYAKRKAKFEQKPKLAPITESDSRRSSQASQASANRNSIDSSNSMPAVTLTEEPELLDTTSERDESMDVKVDNLDNGEPLEKHVLARQKFDANDLYDAAADSVDSVDSLSDGGEKSNESYNIPVIQNNLNKTPEDDSSSLTSSAHAEGYITYSDIAKTRDSGILPLHGEEEEEEKEQEEEEGAAVATAVAATLSTSNENLLQDPSPAPSPEVPEATDSIHEDREDDDDDTESVYQNVVLRRDGSVESLVDPGPTMRPKKPSGPPLPQRDFVRVKSEMATYANFVMDSKKSDNDKAITPKPPPVDTEPVQAAATNRKSYDIDAETKDTGCGPDSSDDFGSLTSLGGGIDNKGFIDIDEDFQLELESVTDFLDEVVFGKGRSTQTGDSLRLANNDQSNLIIQKMNQLNHFKEQTAAAAASLTRPRPISDCAVVDSGTSMDDLPSDEPFPVGPSPPPAPVVPVVMRNNNMNKVYQNSHIQANLRREPSPPAAPSPSQLAPRFPDTRVDMGAGANSGEHEEYEAVGMPPMDIHASIRTIEPPPISQAPPPPKVVDDDDVALPMRSGLNQSARTASISSSLSEDDGASKRRNGKMCIGMTIIFSVIILGIIAAGVIVYFVVKQMDTANDQNIKSYYFGIKLRKERYSADLTLSSSQRYQEFSGDICTFVDEALTRESIFRNIFKECSIMQYRDGNNSLAVHVDMVFLKEKILQLQEYDATPVTGTIEFYLRQHLQYGMGPTIDRFRVTYDPDVNSVVVVQFWNQLSEYGMDPGR